mgnify:CR=1 FL=1
MRNRLKNKYKTLFILEREVSMAFEYNDILEKLKEVGLNQTQLRNSGVFSQSTLTRIRQNQPVTTDTIDVLCQLLHCTPNDIIKIKYNE